MSHPPHEPVGEWWRDQVAALHRWGRLVRRDEDDSVHQMRVTVRRLRSVLATYRPVLDSGRTEPVRSELKWLAAVLGDVRDAEVLHERLRRLAAEHAAARSGIEPLLAALSERRAEGSDRLLRELDGDRYRALVVDLDGIAARFPWSGGSPSHKVLRKLVRRDWKRLTAAVAAAKRAEDPAARRRQLHEVRKKAKRTRYAADVLRDVDGKDAARLVEATKAIQSTLGDLNDAVVMMETIEAYAEPDDTLRDVRADEEAAARAAEERFASVWKKASRPKTHSWLA